MIPVGVVTLDRLDLLRATVNSIYRTAPGAPLAVVDNGSADPLVQGYLTGLERLGARVLRNGRNLGTGKAKNQAARLLPASALICLADNDVIFRPGWVAAAEAAFGAFPELGVLGLWRHPYHRTLAVQRREGCALLVRDLMPGVAWVLRPALWRELGGMVESQVHTYGVEDSDFARRVQARGLWVAALEHDVVEHVGHRRTDGSPAVGSIGDRWEGGPG